MIKKLQILFLLFIPLLFLIIGFRFDRTKFGTDPESAYLLNGLNIGMGKAVGHFDNPGTTVQIYSAVILRLTHSMRNTQEDFQTDVLRHSEYYIEILRYSLIFINAVMILILGLVTLSILGNLWAALVIQVAPFLSLTLIEELFTKVAPEQFLFTAIAILIIILLKLYKSAGPEKIKYPLAFGLLGGFGLATKMTFLPVLIIPFIVLKGKRNKWIYLVSIIPSFVLFTSPAIKGYPHMAKWFLNMGTHTGTYGQGNAGIIDPKVYFNSIISIVLNNKELIAGMILAAIVLLFAFFWRRNQKIKESNQEFYILLAVLIAQAGSILLVAKHYHSNHYLFPALSLTGFVFVSIYMLVNKYISENSRKLFRFVLPGTLAVIIGFSLLNIPFLTQAYNGYRMSNQSTNETMARLEHDYKGYVKVYFYPVSFNEYASLKWGNVYSRQYSTEKLMELFPGGLFYDVRDNIFQFWETTIPPGEFLKKYGGHILMVGGPLNDDDLKSVEASGLKLNKLFEGRIQVVYEIDTAQSAIFRNSIHTGASKKTTSSDFENLSSDGQWVLSDDGTNFCKSSAIVTDKARSGNHSIQLPGMDSYGMEYEPGAVKPGDQFEISIWRLNGNKDVFLVASAGKADPFYLQNSGYVETDSNGWQKVMLDFKIPESFKGNKLKIYLWNHSNNAVWFDDFQINKY